MEAHTTPGLLEVATPARNFAVNRVTSALTTAKGSLMTPIAVPFLMKLEALVELAGKRNIFVSGATSLQNDLKFIALDS